MMPFAGLYEYSPVFWFFMILIFNGQDDIMDITRIEEDFHVSS
jgi:hypothetical protein